MPREIADLAAHDAARSGARRGDAGRLHGRTRRAARHPHRPRRPSPRCWSRCCATSRSSARWSSPAPSTAPTRSCAASPRPASPAEAIHGNKSQNQRERVLGRLPRRQDVKTLVATDIAARGIDVDGISHVINYDLPNIPESYVHRIGRTARAGADGHRDLVLRSRGGAVPARHREADPHEAPGDRPVLRAAQWRTDAAPPAPAECRPAATAQRGRHRAASRGNQGKSAQGRNGHGKPGGQQQQRRGGENRHTPAAAQSSPESIATVAFMRQPEPRRQNTGDNNRNAR